MATTSIWKKLKELEGGQEFGGYTKKEIIKLRNFGIKNHFGCEITGLQKDNISGEMLRITIEFDKTGKVIFWSRTNCINPLFDITEHNWLEFFKKMKCPQIRFQKEQM